MASKDVARIAHLLDALEDKLERGMEESKRARSSGTPSCTSNGSCYYGNDPSKDCCAGHVTQSAGDIVYCTAGYGCEVCQKAAGALLNKGLSADSCAAIDLEGMGICEAVFLGPEDPLADACALAIPYICPKLMSLITQGDSDKAVQKTCETLKFCAEGQS